MRLLPFTPLALLLLTSVVGAADPPHGPRMAFDEKEHVFPRAVQGDQVTHAFHFKNKGDANLEIKHVYASCNCTVSRIPKMVIPPGEEGSIELTLDTSDKLGASVVVKATVITNDPLESEQGPGTSLLALKGEVASYYRMAPQGAFFGSIVRHQNETARDIIVRGDLDAAHFKITAVESPVDWIRGEFRDRGDGTSLVRVIVLPHVPAGEVKATVTVKTDFARQPSFRIPVVGLASGPIRSTELLLFGRFQRGQEPEQFASLDRLDGLAAVGTIANLAFDRTRFAIAEVPGTGNNRVLRITVRKDAPPGPFASSLVVSLDDRESPELRTLLLGEILPRVLPFPAALVLQPREDKASFVVSVTGGKITAVTIEGFTGEATIEDPGAREPRIVVHPAQPLAPGPAGAIVLTTDVPGEETVRVPVIVRASG